jgi:hypothetical protein
MSTCLIGVHAIHYRPADLVYERVEIAPLSLSVHVWVDLQSLEVIEQIERLITFERTDVGRVGAFTRDVVLLKLTPMGTEGVSSLNMCDLAEALDAGVYSAAVNKTLGPWSVSTLFALARRRLPLEPAPQGKWEKPACSFVTLWDFHPGSEATFLGVLDLNLETSHRRAIALADGLEQLLERIRASLSLEDQRAIGAPAAYLRCLAVDPRWPAAEIRAQLTLAGESLGDGATAEQADLLCELAQRFGVSADITGSGEA